LNREQSIQRHLGEPDLCPSMRDPAFHLRNLEGGQYGATLDSIATIHANLGQVA
jgi:hypothetical protein